MLSSLNLDTDEDHSEQSESKQIAPDLAIPPWIRHSSPLQCQQQANNSANQKCCANKIHLFNLALQ